MGGCGEEEDMKARARLQQRHSPGECDLIFVRPILPAIAHTFTLPPSQNAARRRRWRCWRKENVGGCGKEELVVMAMAVVAMRRRGGGGAIGGGEKGAEAGRRRGPCGDEVARRGQRQAAA